VMRLSGQEDWMTTIHHRPSRRPLKLVHELVVAVLRLTARKPPPYVVSVDEVARAIGRKRSTEFDDAIAFSIRAQLIVGDEATPPSSISLTEDGLALAQAGGYGAAWGVAMPNSRKAPTKVRVLVRQFVKAAHELTHDKRPPYWIAIEKVVAKLGIRDSGQVNAAIAYAVAHRLLRVDTADDPLSVTVTAEGVKLASRT
jgi:hypothetical protein